MKSILQDEKKCFLCGTTLGLHCHHIFGGNANRKKSEKYGLKIWLCGTHHNLSSSGIHFNKGLDLSVKKMAQRKFEETHTREEFMQIFGKNYL